MGFIPSLRDKHTPIPAFTTTCFSAASALFKHFFAVWYAIETFNVSLETPADI